VCSAPAPAMAQPATDWGGIDVEACHAYALGRQTGRGGFCYYAYVPWGVDEPNPPDTHAALGILRLLHRPVPRAGDCLDWLLTLQDASGGYASLLIAWSAVKALRLLSAAPSRDPRRYLANAAARLLAVPRAGQARIGWLANLWRCFDLWAEFGLVPDAPLHRALADALAMLRGEEGGYGAPGANLPETSMAVALAAAAHLPDDRSAAEYARRCERPPYGFNITPQAVSSSLECQLAGLRVLRAYGSAPAGSNLIRDYVRACQTDTGGFGRVPRAIPSLQDSHRALECLALLTGSGGATRPPRAVQPAGTGGQSTCESAPV
jgi:hypothetical protein